MIEHHHPSLRCLLVSQSGQLGQSGQLEISLDQSEAFLDDLDALGVDWMDE